MSQFTKKQQESWRNLSPDAREEIVQQAFREKGLTPLRKPVIDPYKNKSEYVINGVWKDWFFESVVKGMKERTSGHLTPATSNPPSSDKTYTEKGEWTDDQWKSGLRIWLKGK